MMNALALAMGGNLTRPAPFVTILDSLSVSSAAAFSTRKLRSAYAGACMNVRRSSDNAAQDIGFVNGVLDTASLLAFVGANNGFVTTWYDQSGNGRDATQATAASQPRIVASGVVDLFNSRPTIRTAGSGPNVQFTSTNQPVPFTVNSLVKCQSVSTRQFFYGSGNFILGVFSDALNYELYDTGSSLTGHVTGVDTNSNIYTAIYNSASSAVYKNGAIEVGPGTTGGASTSLPISIGSATISPTTSGDISIPEFVMFYSLLSTTDRQSLERNQEAYYGIAGV